MKPSQICHAIKDKLVKDSELDSDIKVTLFAVPKSFKGHFAMIQRNALGSWMAQGPYCQVILAGDEEGTTEAAAEFSIKHIPYVAKNERGTPLLNSLFREVRKTSNSKVFCFINSDIMLTPNLVDVVSRVPFKTFLMVGRRYNVNINQLWNFASENWDTRLVHLAEQVGEMDQPCAIDYFVFTRDLFQNIPEFAIGRIGYDNWLIYKARSEKVPVLDASKVITAVHQNHDYSHYPSGYYGTREGPEAKRNMDLCGGGKYRFSITDSTWILSGKGLRRALSYGHISRLFDSIPVLYPKLKYPIVILGLMLKTLIKDFRFIKRIQ